MKKLAQAFGRILRNRWLLLAIGLLCISALVWFLGPLIVIGDLRPLESVDARLLTILVLVVLWGMNNLRLGFQERQRSRKINAELAGSGDTLADPAHRKAAAEEIAALSRDFENTAHRLKRVSRSGIGDKKSLYQLPWYLVLGPSAAGKTTMLRKSGIRFSLITSKEQRSVKAARDSRYCQWWLADEAVIIDTAGRHTLQQDNPMVDGLVWQKLVTLLQKQRPRQPVNGIILAISMADLLTSDSNQRSAHADAIRHRLQELSLEFKRSIPIYCVVTQCDQVAGFVEFFDNLDPTTKEQVWGITFGLDDGRGAEGPIENFGAEYDQLIERLQTRLAEHLNREVDIGRRARIQGFPTQMQLLRQPLNDHLTDIFRRSRFDGQVQLRGVYFTSAAQTGMPVDYLTTLLTSMFGIKAPPQSAYNGAASSYFLKPLLMDVIFREAGLVTNSARSIRRRRLIRRAVTACACLLFLATGFAWWVSFNRNQNYISTVEAKVTEFGQTGAVLSQDITDINAPLPLFDLLRTIPGGYADRGKATPLAATFGLDQRDKLGSATGAAYQRVLQSALLPRLIHRLEQQIRENLDQPALLSETLKTYLMLEDPTRFDRDAVDRWYQVDVNRWLPGSANAYQRVALQGHLAALFEQQLAPPLPDENLVGQARQVLGSESTAERAYAKIRAKAQRNTRPWTLRQSLGRVADRVFDQASIQTVPGFFTVESYRRIFPNLSLPIVKELVDDAWVVGVDEVAEQNLIAAYDALHDDVIDLYLADYVEQWDSLLRDVRLIRPRGLQQVGRLVEDLIGDDAVLRRFFEEISKQTKLSRPSDIAAEAESVAGLADVADLAEEAERFGDGLAQLGTNITGLGSPFAERDPGLTVEQRYSRIHMLVESGSDGEPKIERVISLLERYGRHIAAVSGDGRSRRSLGQDDIDLDIALLAERQVEPLRSWILQITGQAGSLSGRQTRALINEKWNGQLASLCQTVLTNQYPFNANSPTDLSLDDFAKFFAPNGLLDAFFKENLEGLVDTSSRPWKARASGNSTIRIAPAAIRAFEQAALIRETFFRNSGSPEYSFVLSPIYLDSAVSKFQLELGDQRIAYRHGPVRARQLTWPGTNAIAGARLVFTTFEPAGLPASLSAPGVWGWFRLLDRFQGRSETPTTSDLIDFEIHGFRATYALNPMTSNVVAVSRLFDSFRCPSSL